MLSLCGRCSLIGKSFLWFPWFCLLCGLWVSLEIPSSIRTEACSSLNCNSVSFSRSPTDVTRGVCVLREHKLVHAQGPTISQLSFKCSYQVAPTASAPGKLWFFVFACLCILESAVCLVTSLLWWIHRVCSFQFVQLFSSCKDGD